MLKKLNKYLLTPEKNGKRIGLFRTITSIFGGFIVAYLGMTALAIVIPLEIQQSAIFSIMFNTLAWAIATVYIALTYTKLSTLLRFLVPSIIFSITILLYTKGF